MDSSLRSRLTALQLELLAGFFARERRFFLTGGAALAGFYFGHRDTEDLDLFTGPGTDLADAARTVADVASAAGARAEATNTHRDFRRLAVVRGDESTLVDLVVDRAAMVDPDKRSFGAVRVDTPREIAANKICTLISRSEIKDLVDLRMLVGSGVDLRRAFEDARQKDATADPATLAFILDELYIGAEAALPGGVDPQELAGFRKEFVRNLRGEAFALARKK